MLQKKNGNVPIEMNIDNCHHSLHESTGFRD